MYPLLPTYSILWQLGYVFAWFAVVDRALALAGRTVPAFAVDADVENLF
jgi:hypothetical protein